MTLNFTNANKAFNIRDCPVLADWPGQTIKISLRGQLLFETSIELTHASAILIT